MESCGEPQFFYLNKHIMQGQRGKDFSGKMNALNQIRQNNETTFFFSLQCFT
ncbi:hypothetical protein BSI_27070 [Bacillus inaquosorum KCTC 13429]|uniref:Uncharacterized protein n=1 Tax=Bacillus inaquosorum KCTC 13429 TaxID=1236548 RepID=A0A9W5LIE0_9BACI|nr:hypothetical protein BSI_27070 [Bacillus inaquosorum KCTC 13429]